MTEKRTAGNGNGTGLSPEAAEIFKFDYQNAGLTDMQIAEKWGRSVGTIVVVPSLPG